ncbi:hypothetical protein CEXT_766611 [Caerostris extrusa]|uniref:Uncharacterized protein n=1 Tax=Caerostris extrusa TaxID=172846 RepID=A0AAV4N9D7_CAEEX|nr:hypothetical protein CEXT_766611 [Caerostris extrusa]
MSDLRDDFRHSFRAVPDLLLIQRLSWLARIPYLSLNWLEQLLMPEPATVGDVSTWPSIPPNFGNIAEKPRYLYPPPSVSNPRAHL